MSDDTNTDDLQVDELSVLKKRAQMMGVAFSNNIGIETLRERIAAKMAETPPVETARPEQPNPLANPLSHVITAPSAPQAPAPTTAKKKTLRQHLIETQMALVRVRITCLDPKKKDLPGEIITVANEYLGTVRKYVPFGEKTDEGWHIPVCIYEILKNREFLSIKTISRGQKDIVESRYVKEFAIEVLPPLTPAELKQLAATQAAAGGVE